MSEAAVEWILLFLLAGTLLVLSAPFVLADLVEQLVHPRRPNDARARSGGFAW